MITNIATIQDFSNAGYLRFKNAGETVIDELGRKVVHASIDLRTGRYAVLVTWLEQGFLKRDLIVVSGDYKVKVQGNSERLQVAERKSQEYSNGGR